MLIRGDIAPLILILEQTFIHFFTAHRCSWPQSTSPARHSSLRCHAHMLMIFSRCRLSSRKALFIATAPRPPRRDAWRKSCWMLSAARRRFTPTMPPTLSDAARCRFMRFRRAHDALYPRHARLIRFARSASMLLLLRADLFTTPISR